MLLILDSYNQDTKETNISFNEYEFSNDMQCRIKHKAEEFGIEVYLNSQSTFKNHEEIEDHREFMVNNYWIEKNKPDALYLAIDVSREGKEYNETRGTESIVSNNASIQSKDAAQLINNEVVLAFKHIDLASNDRGVNVEDLPIITKVKMPSLFLKYGYCTNKEDLLVLKEHREELAVATVKGICKYFNMDLFY